MQNNTIQRNTIQRNTIHMCIYTIHMYIYIYLFTLCFYNIYIYTCFTHNIYIYICITYKNNTNHPILASVFGYSRTSSRWPSFFGRPAATPDSKQRGHGKMKKNDGRWRDTHGEIYGNMTTQYFIGERAIKFNWLHYPLILACSNAVIYV